MPISPRVSVRFTRATLNCLQHLAAQNKMTPSSMFRVLVAEALAARHGADSPVLEEALPLIAEVLGLSPDSSPQQILAAMQEAVAGIEAAANADPLASGGADSPPTTADIALRALSRVESMPLDATDRKLMAKLSAVEKDRYLDLRLARLRAAVRHA